MTVADPLSSAADRHVRQYRQWCRAYLAASVAGLAAVMLFNFAVDPFQQYRRAAFYKPIFTQSKQRHINPGIAKNYPYDAVIIGSSMSESFQKLQVDKVLRWDVAKLPMAGMTAHEMRKLLDLVLAGGKARTVMVVLDFFAFYGDVDRFFLGADSMPLYLYDDSRWNDCRYLLNADATYASIEALLPFMKPKRRSYEHAYVDVFTPDVKDLLRRYRTGAVRTITDEPCDVGRMMTSFRRNLLDVVAARRDVRFIMLYPPYSVLVWHEAARHGSFGKLLEFKERSAEELLRHPHVEVYDFQHDAAIVTELSNYKDAVHYSHEVAAGMIRSIAAGEGRVRPGGMQANVTALDRLVRDFRVPPVAP